MHIIEQVKKHDSRNIEIKYTFPLDARQRKIDYQTEMYLFVPASLGINSESYTSDKFYQDERNYIRLKTPQVLLRNFIDGTRSPLSRLKKSMESLATSPQDAKKRDSYLLTIKIFCYMFKSALRDGSGFIINNSMPGDKGKMIRNFINETRDVLKSFRDADLIIRVPVIDSGLQEMFSLADEYICLLADKYIFLLLGYVEKYAFNEKAIVVLFLDELTQYRKKKNFIIASSDISNEELLYRMSALKKIMGEVLYINTMTRKEGRFLDMVIPGIAAGIAMGTATLLLYFSGSNVNELTLTLFLCIVGIYIIKDRMKDWVKILFAKHMRGFIFDFRTLLLTGKGKKLGTRRENFQFIYPEKMPKEVICKRQRISDGLESVRPGEQILHTRRRIHLRSCCNSELLDNFQVDGIHDIVRFNFGRFLSRMDNPVKRLFILDKGKRAAISGRRVYHVNMVLRFSSRDFDELRRFRLVLSREGIERIEEKK